MLSLFGFGKKAEEGGKSTDWYFDRYQNALVQRNYFLLIMLILALLLALCLLNMHSLIRSRSLDLFVVEMDPKSGVVTVVDQSRLRNFTSNDSVTNFFIYEYIKSRETFDPRNFDYEYNKKVRILSSSQVYESFKRSIRQDNPESPPNLYASNLRSNLRIKSIQELKKETIQIRFSIETEMQDGRIIKKDRIAILNYKYAELKMDEEERRINPLGFQVVGYKVSDESL